MNKWTNCLNYWMRRVVLLASGMTLLQSEGCAADETLITQLATTITDLLLQYFLQSLYVL